MRDVEEVFGLPPIAFDGPVLEGTDADVLLRTMRRLAQKPHCPPILVCLFGAGAIRRLLVAGAHEVIACDDADGPPRLLGELLERFERPSSWR